MKADKLFEEAITYFKERESWACEVGGDLWMGIQLYKSLAQQQAELKDAGFVKLPDGKWRYENGEFYTKPGTLEEIMTSLSDQVCNAGDEHKAELERLGEFRDGCLALIPKECRIAAREGGGLEDRWASLAISIAKLVHDYATLAATNKARKEAGDEEQD